MCVQILLKNQKMKNSYLHILALALMASVSAQSEKLRISVLEFENNITSPSRDEADAAKLLRDEIEHLVYQAGRYDVISSTERKRILDEQKYQSKSGCVDESCAVEIGQMLGAEKMIVGSVGKLGSIYRMSAKMLDIETGAIERSGSYDTRNNIEDLLINGTSDIVEELIGTSYQNRIGAEQSSNVKMGYISIITDPPGISVHIDGEKIQQKTPIQEMELPVGRHTLVLKSRRYDRISQVIDVKDGSNQPINIIMATKNGPLYIGNQWQKDVNIYIDDVFKGTNPLDIELPFGKHSIRMEKEYYVSSSSEINISDEPISIEPNLLPNEVMVEFITRPRTARAILFVDGIRRGVISSNGLELRLKPGDYTIELKSSDHKKYSAMLSVPPGNYIEKEISLVRKTDKGKKSRKKDEQSHKFAMGIGASYGLPGLYNYNARIVTQSKRTKESYYHFEFAQTVFPFWDEGLEEQTSQQNYTQDVYSEPDDEYYGIARDGGYINGTQFSIGVGSIDGALNMLFGQTEYIGYGLSNDTYSYLGASLKVYLKRMFLELGYISGIDAEDEEFFESKEQIYFQVGFHLTLKL